MENTQQVEITLDDIMNQSMEQVETTEVENKEITLDTLLETPKEEAVVAETPKTEELPKQEDTQTKTTVWGELIKDHLEDGEWKDAILNIDGKEVKLSELEEVDKKTYKRIQQTFDQKKKEEDKGKYLSTEGLTEEDIKLFELKKKGEDISEYLRFEQEYVHPLKNLDLDDERVQEDLVRRNLAYKGDDPEEIDLKIELYKKRLILDVKAEEAVKLVDDLYKKTVNEKVEERNKEIAEYEVKQKEAKKATIEKYKEFGLDEKTYKPLLEAGFKVDNGLTEADKIYFNAKNDNPELFAKVLYLLKNPKQYEEFFGTKIKNQSALENISIISTIDKKVSTAEQEQTKKDAWDDIIIEVK